MTRLGKTLIPKYNLEVSFTSKHSEVDDEGLARLNYADLLTRWIMIKSIHITASVGFLYILLHSLIRGI